MVTFDNIVNKIASVINIEHKMAPITKISELGIDSLDILLVIYTIEKDFNIELKVSDIEKEITIQEIVELINYKSNDCDTEAAI